MNSQTNTKSFVALIGLIALTLIIPLTVLLAKNSQDIRKKAAGAVVGLSVTPDTVQKNVGETFISHLWLNTGTQKIGFAKVRVTFNKNVLNLASDIVTTPSMSNVVALSTVSEANSTGVIDITIGVQGGQVASAPLGAIDFATLSFRGVAGGTSPVTFDTDNCQIVQVEGYQAMTYDSSAITNASYTIGDSDGKLVITSESLAYPLNQVFTAKVMLDAKANNISFAQVDIAFDNTILNVAQDITTNSILSNKIYKITPSEANTTGHIKFTIGIPGGQTALAPNGVIELAQIPLKGIANGSGNLTPNLSGTEITSTVPKRLILASEKTVFTIGEGTTPPSVTPSTTPHTSPTPGISVPPGQTGIDIKLKINGINSARDIVNNSQSFKVTLFYPATGGTFPFTLSAFNIDSKGVFEMGNNLANIIKSGDSFLDNGKIPITLFIKGPNTLQKKYSITMFKGIMNNIDLTVRPRDYLDACDVPDPNNNYEQDGMCNSVDYTLVSDRINMTNAEARRVADLNIDGVINGVDLNILVNSINTRYEDEVL